MESEKKRMTPAELPIWRYIADHQPVTVRQVADYVSGTSGQARTTVLTMIESLRKKGYLTRQKLRGVHHYWLCDPKAVVQQSLVRDFVDNALGGSLSPFMTYLTKAEPLREDELRELKAVVDELLTRPDKPPL